MTTPARGRTPNQRGIASWARSNAASANVSIASRDRNAYLESLRSRLSTGVTSRDPKLRSAIARISASSSATVARPSRWIESGEREPRRRLNRSPITRRTVGIRRNADHLPRPRQVLLGEELPVLPYRRHDGVRDEATQLVAESGRGIAQRRTIQRRSIDPLVQQLVELLDHDTDVPLRRGVAQSQPLALVRHLARDVHRHLPPPREGLLAQLLGSDRLHSGE